MKPFDKRRKRARIVQIGVVKDGIATGWMMKGPAAALTICNGKPYLGGWSVEELSLIANGSK